MIEPVDETNNPQFDRILDSVNSDELPIDHSYDVDVEFPELNLASDGKFPIHSI